MCSAIKQVTALLGLCFPPRLHLIRFRKVESSYSKIDNGHMDVSIDKIITYMTRECTLRESSPTLLALVFSECV